MDFTIRRAGHVVLRVTDAAAEQAFLERVVGFQTTGQFGGFIVFMSANPISNHHMIALTSRPGTRLPDPARDIGMVSIAYEVTDRDELAQLFDRIRKDGASYGATIVEPLRRTTVERFVCADQDGNRLEFYCPASDDAAPPLPTLVGMRVGVRRTSHLTLRCADRAASADFYARVLGLFEAGLDADGRLLLSADPSTRRPLFALEQATDPNVGRPEPGKAYGLEHFSLEVGSFAQLQAGYRHLKALAVPIDHVVDHNVTNSVYFTDPDGNRIEIYHDVPRAEYRNPENPWENSMEPLEARLQA